MQAGLEPPNREREREREREKKEVKSCERESGSSEHIKTCYLFHQLSLRTSREARRSRLKEVSITLPTRYVVVSARAPVIIALYCLTIGILGTVVE